MLVIQLGAPATFVYALGSGDSCPQRLTAPLRLHMSPIFRNTGCTAALLCARCATAFSDQRDEMGCEAAMRHPVELGE